MGDCSTYENRPHQSIPRRKPMRSDPVSDARVPSVESDRVGESSMKKKKKKPYSAQGIDDRQITDIEHEGGSGLKGQGHA